MARDVIIDEFHVTVSAPHGLQQPEYDAISQALDDKQFQADLRRRVKAVFHGHPTLRKAKIKLSR